jgi:hypothetical protein
VVVDEDEIGHVGPNVAPAAGKHAGARGGSGGTKAEEDDAKKLVWETADAVMWSP